jgi:hypothetical protein
LRRFRNELDQANSAFRLFVVDGAAIVTAATARSSTAAAFEVQ